MELRATTIGALAAWPLLLRLYDEMEGAEVSTKWKMLQHLFFLPSPFVAEMLEGLYPSFQYRKTRYDKWAPIQDSEVEADVGMHDIYALLLESINVNFMQALSKDRTMIQQASKFSAVQPRAIPSVFSGLIQAGWVTAEALETMSLETVLDLNEQLAAKIENERRAYEEATRNADA